ncbi:EG45-like domain containing protein [Tasmannia lanceolata]|uniref:EG45-like domain containing protein n=1 Tax=Tasmannia lanceolata TaxID=3420 RepID=UPI0040637BF5
MRIWMKICVALVFAAVLGLVPLTDAVPGTAIYHTAPYVPSSCYGHEDKGVMLASASDAIWDNGAACGRRYSIRCTGPTNQGVPQPCRGSSVVVMIDDHCASCQATLDLSQEAFSEIADLSAGKIKIDYQQV